MKAKNQVEDPRSFTTTSQTQNKKDNDSMLSTWWKTLQYARLVRSVPAVPTDSFVARQGGTKSDMFCLSWPPSQSANEDSVSLQDYHAAFLTSPLFQIELFLLTVVSAADRSTAKKDHLEMVAAGEAKSFGPWRLKDQEGDTKKVFTSATTTTATRIMQCQMDGKPFCDTWWAVQQTPQNGVELVFGSDIERYTEGGVKSWLVWALMPFHDVYSRLLLGSTAANLEERLQKRKQ